MGTRSHEGEALFKHVCKHGGPIPASCQHEFHSAEDQKLVFQSMQVWMHFLHRSILSTSPTHRVETSNDVLTQEWLDISGIDIF